MLTFDVCFVGEPAAGLMPYNYTITMHGGEENDGAAEHMRQALAEYYDGATVTLCLWYWYHRLQPHGPYVSLIEALEAARTVLGEGHVVSLTDGTVYEGMLT